MCLAQGQQHSDSGEARTRGLSVSSQALYHWAIALPKKMYTWILVFFTVFLKNRNISSKIKRSKVTDYAALRTYL